MADEGKAPGLALAAVFCHDYAPDQSGAFVRIYNAAEAPADLAAAVLEWDGVPLAFPASQPLEPGASRFVAWDPAGFRRLFSREPDYRVAAASGGGVPALTPQQTAPAALRPEGGTIRLLSAGSGGQVLDALVWGSGAAVDGWSGPPLAPADQGIVYQRALLEESLGTGSAGRFDTDPASAAAWRQGADWLPRRLVRVGQSELDYPSFTLDGVLAFPCPDSSFAAISQFIDAAAQTLLINLYLFTHPDLAGRVEAAIERGVAVRLLLEGEPYMGVPASHRDTLTRLQRAGAGVRVLRAAADGFKRYQYNHAKYAVADGHRCLIMSDNWTKASVPTRSTSGNRGRGVIVESAALAAHLTRIFEEDWNPERPDSAVFDPGRHMAQPVTGAEGAPRLMGAAPAGVDRLPFGLDQDGDPDSDPNRNQRDPVQPKQIDGPLQATLFTAPEHALLETRGICGLMRGARQSLDVLQNSIELYWEIGDNGSMATTPNLFLLELAAAARRGIKVRVLLDGSFLDDQDPRDNGHTRDWLQALAAQEKLDLEARVLDRQATGMGIHDKGLIIDGHQVLISSINWSENSPLRNRELGLVLESEAVAAYFGALFDRDWAGGK